MKKMIALTVVALFATRVAAISTSHWVHGNANDFKGGRLHNVVVTNLGDVKLSRDVQIIQEQDPSVTAVDAMAEAPDGTLYAGTGPKGILLAVKDGKVSTVAQIEGAINILSLLYDDQGGLLIGTGGEKGKVYRVDKPGDPPHEIFAADGVQYVLALRKTRDGTVYAATGPTGKLFEIKPDGSHSEIYKSSENNITSLATDGNDNLYLGTDPNGLVIRFNRTTHESFILYNAGESEIAALTMDSAGNLYAATGEAGERQGGHHEDAAKRAGRPEGENGAAPIPAVPPSAPPQPPQAPNPNPGEPKPIPKSPTSFAPLTQFQLVDFLLADSGPKPDDIGDDDKTAHRDTPPGSPDHPDASKREGNAIYKIDKEGFVTEIFRQTLVIYSMITQNDTLLIGTGDEGNIYQVNPSAEETIVLARVDAKQVLCLLPAKDGRIYIGRANTGGISAMTSGFAQEGTYISPVLDATQVSRFGKIQLHGQLPDGTQLKVSTRSGNVKDADSPGWSKWSDEQNAAEFIKVTAPSARFLQYRLTFSTTDPARTPVVDYLNVAYQIPNLAPVIKSVKIGSGNESGDNVAAAPTPPGPAHPGEGASKTPLGTGVQPISWEASDPNNDTLSFSLYFRMGQSSPWILLKDKLKDNNYDWDTRTVADGRYQVKIVASDAASNPPGEGKTTSRVSDFFVIDNTPPVIGDLVATPDGNAVKVSLRVQDRTSIVANVEFTVDSSEEWQAVLPVDNIYDSPDETVVFTIKGLAPGSHQVSVRATDSHGNQALQTLVVKTAGATARTN